jgi:LacI family transcriptional regulator
LVDKTGYAPNIAAKALRTRTARAIGLVIPDLYNEFFLRIVNSVEKFFFANDYSLFVGSAGLDMDKNHALIRNLLGKGVDGLIYISRFPLEMDVQSVPTVFLDQMAEQNGSHATVSSDNYQGGRLAAETLWRAGSRKPVIVCGREDLASLSSVQDRVRGFVDAIRDLGVAWSEKDVIYTPSDISETRKKMGKALRGGLYFDGIFGTADQIALGAILALEDHGYRVPDDVNVCGFDDISISGYFKPSLTTIHQDTVKLGIASAKTLLAIMQNEILIPQRIEIPVRLVARNSTRRAPAGMRTT